MGCVCLGCVCPREERVSAQGRGCLPRGGSVCPEEGVSAQGRECLPKGVSAKGVSTTPIIFWDTHPLPIECWDTNPMHIAWWDTHPLWTEGMTHACENITLPQTSFASGNKVTIRFRVLLSSSFSYTNSNSNLVVNLCILWSCCFKRQTVLLCENRHDNANRLSNLIRTTIQSEQSKSQRQNVRFRKFNFFSYDIFLSFTKWWFLIIMLDRCKINLSDSKRHNSSHWCYDKTFYYSEKTLLTFNGLFFRTNINIYK